MRRDDKKSIKLNTMTTETLVNHETGIVTSEMKTTTYAFEREDDYIKFYVKSLLYMADLPHNLNPILAKLLQFMPYAGGDHKPVFALNKALKAQIGTELGYKGKDPSKAVSDAITSFVKGQILFREGTGLYMFNPHLFGRGEWADIKKLRLQVDFTPEHRTVKGQIERKAREKYESQCEGQISLDGDEMGA